jgi:hypothetical protein
VTAPEVRALAVECARDLDALAAEMTASLVTQIPEARTPTPR